METQAKENAYDLEANLAVLKLYQFNPAFFQTTVTAQILLKALTNLPHTDFTLCKCMIDQAHVSFQHWGQGLCGKGPESKCMNSGGDGLWVHPQTPSACSGPAWQGAGPCWDTV